MATNYIDIYKSAITEFKDPTLKSLLENNTILFMKTMHNFLLNALALFTNPRQSRVKLSYRISPTTSQYEFSGDGNLKDFIVVKIPNENIENYITECKINGTECSYIYDNHKGILSFDIPPSVGSNIEFEVYGIGYFEKDLSQGEIYVLSQLIVSCWSEFITNDKLDIIRLLGDTDFKLTSNANTTNAKINWSILTKENAIKRMNKFAWDFQMNGGKDI